MMLYRSLFLSLALTLPIPALAANIFVPSGPFELKIPMDAPCFKQRRTSPTDMQCVPTISDAVEEGLAFQNSVDRAEGFVFHRRIELAEAEISKALERYPMTASIWHFSARLHLIAGREAEARAAMQKAMALDPQDGDVLATAAYLSLLANDMWAALQQYEQALLRSPNNQHALVQTVFLSETLGDTHLSYLAVTRIIDRLPAHPVAVGRSIDRALARGDFQFATEKAAEAVANPMSGLLERVRLVQILQTHNEHDRAVTVLDEVIGREGDPPRFVLDSLTRAKLLFSRARSRKELKQFEQAKQDVVGALKSADPKMLLRIGVFLVSQGFDDLKISKYLTPELENNAMACIQNPACGLGLTQKL